MSIELSKSDPVNHIYAVYTFADCPIGGVVAESTLREWGVNYRMEDGKRYEKMLTIVTEKQTNKCTHYWRRVY